MKLYLATGNKGKVEELLPLVKEFLPEFTEIFARAPKDADEIENTFLGNSKIKALALLKELILENEVTPFAILSDDSGLEVAALGGQPGVHSARYAGVHSDSVANMKKLLQAMAGVEDRSCRYVCSLYLHIQRDAQTARARFSEGYCEGIIMQDAKGQGGFGYDPIFWSVDLAKRMSEASLEEKNLYSHRRSAFEGIGANSLG